MFPIPRITESFVDSVARDLGWQRYLDVHTPLKGRLNADYLADGAIIELKILEEEGLEKAERQRKLAKLLSVSELNATEVDIDFENIPASIKQEVQKIVSMPIQSAVKKASKQIRHSGEDLAKRRVDLKRRVADFAQDRVKQRAEIGHLADRIRRHGLRRQNREGRRRQAGAGIYRRQAQALFRRERRDSIPLRERLGDGADQSPALGRGVLGRHARLIQSMGQQRRRGAAH